MTKKIPPVLIEIRPSKKIPGEIGLFAVRNLKKESVIGKAKYFKVNFFPWKEFEKLERQSQKKVGAFCLGTDKGFYAPEDFNYMSIPWHMNHSCDGNVGFNNKGDFVTMKAVKKDTELCWDYALAETNPKYTMHCKCGSSHCRKLITGNDWKDPAFRKKNKKYFFPELKKLI